jgi:hypothetical protein
LSQDILKAHGSVIFFPICFFFDGSNVHPTYFDDLAKDEGYAASIETSVNHMASSHAVKRCFQAISHVRVWLFRKVLQQLFIWRLRIEQPKIIKLGLDTMVMDNDDALKREGVNPTYKKVKGFQPLQLYRGRYIVDAMFRNGKAHSNHGNHVYRMLKGIVRLIRKHYSKDVPIIYMADTGFYDNELFKLCDRLQTGFVFGVKMYDEIEDILINKPDNEFFEYKKNGKTSLFCEFEDKRKSWDTTWRTMYTKPVADDEGQILLQFAGPETIIYTNIRMNNSITRSILNVKETKDTTINPQAIITLYHPTRS